MYRLDNIAHEITWHGVRSIAALWLWNPTHRSWIAKLFFSISIYHIIHIIANWTFTFVYNFRIHGTWIFWQSLYKKAPIEPLPHVSWPIMSPQKVRASCSKIGFIQKRVSSSNSKALSKLFSEVIMSNCLEFKPASLIQYFTLQMLCYDGGYTDI